MSGFAGIVEGYVAERRAAGFRLEGIEPVMARIVALHAELGCPGDALPRELVEEFVAKRPGERETTRLNRVSQIRGLASYMARMGLPAHVPPGGGRRGEGRYEPHIFTDGELGRLFAAADDLSDGGVASTRAQKALVLRLLYSTGMRSGEACALRKEDVDLRAGVVAVRHAKNDRDRLVPLHPSVAGRMADFAEAARSGRARYCDEPSFWSADATSSITTGTVYRFFRMALWRAGISHGGRGRGPRVHDLRHTFACHRLRAWAREGADVGALMPVLAAYMGHADTRCTEYYLRLTAEALPSLAARAEAECGWVVPS